MKNYAGIILGTCLVVYGAVSVNISQFGPSVAGVFAGGRADTTLGKSDSYTMDSLRRLEDRLRSHPNDGDGWNAVAPVYLKFQRYADAARAYQKAIRLLGDNASRLLGIGVAEVFANSGIMNDTAREAFKKALELDTSLHIARYWLAIDMEQEGRFDAAAQAWQSLLTRGPANANWRPQAEYCRKAVRIHLGKASAAAGAKRSAVLCSKGGAYTAAKPALHTPKTTKAEPRGSHSTAAQADKRKSSHPSSMEFAAARQAAEKMAPAERMAMVNQMVEGLAERLKENGKDLEGWVKLVRSYAVLGKRDNALEALRSAKENFKGDPAAIGTLNLLKQRLNLGS